MKICLSKNSFVFNTFFNTKLIKLSQDISSQRITRWKEKNILLYIQVYVLYSLVLVPLRLKQKPKKLTHPLKTQPGYLFFFSPSWSKISKHNPDFNLVMSQSEKNQQTLVRKWIKKPIFCHVAFLSCAIKLGRNSQKWKTRRKTLLKPNLAGSFFFFLLNI